MLCFCRDVVEGSGDRCDLVDVVDVLSGKMELFENER